MIKVLKLVSIAFFVFYLGSAYATIQPGDTLLGNMAKIPPEQKVEYLLKKLESTPNLPLAEAIAYAEEGLEWAKQYNNDKDKARLFNYLGNKYYLLGNFDRSLVCYQDALRITMRIGKKDELVVLIRKLGMVNFNKNDYKKSLLYFQQCLKIYQELGYPIREAEIYSNMGAIFFHWKEYEKALDNYELAFNIYKDLEYLPSLANVLYLKALTLQKLDRFDESIQWFAKALEVNEKLSNKNDIAKIYNAIGETYLSERKLDKALEYFQHAYAIHEKMNDQIVIAQSLNNLGNVYKELGDFAQSIDFLSRSMNIAKDHDLKLTLMDNYKSYYELFYVQNNSKKALAYYQQYVKLRDSIFNLKDHTNEEGIDLVDSEVLELKKEIHQKNQQTRLMNILWGGFVLLLLSLIVFMRLRKN